EKAQAELIPIINKQWDEMPEEEKDKYVQVAESLKEYLPAGKAGKEMSDELSGKKKSAQKDPVEAQFIHKSGIKRPPKNGFTLFYQEHAADLQDVPPKDRMGKAATRWKQEM